MAAEEFLYTFRVSFHDTDAMGVMHHAAFLRKFEDARVSWLRESGLSRWHMPHFDIVLAVVSADCQYKKPCTFDQELKLKLQFQRKGILLQIRYSMYDCDDNLLATGHTEHVPMNGALKVVKYPPHYLKVLENEKWTETWP